MPINTKTTQIITKTTQIKKNTATHIRISSYWPGFVVLTLVGNVKPFEDISELSEGVVLNSRVRVELSEEIVALS